MEQKTGEEDEQKTLVEEKMQTCGSDDFIIDAGWPPLASYVYIDHAVVSSTSRLLLLRLVNKCADDSMMYLCRDDDTHMIM